jgi:ribosomal protein L37E
MLYGGLSSKPQLEAVMRKIKRYRDKVYPVIALRLLENIREPSQDQLEFIIQNGGPSIIGEIDRLYRLAKKMGREDLIGYLSYVWEKYGRPTPVRCPRCGFRAVMPDYTCLVCGYVVSEDYVREQLGFDEKFRIYVEQASVAELRDVLELGYVLVGEDGVVSPRYGFKVVDTRKYYYRIYLKKKDRALVMEAISKRKIEV